jgi:hypothetical protein
MNFDGFFTDSKMGGNLLVELAGYEPRRGLAAREA